MIEASPAAGARGAAGLVMLCLLAPACRDRAAPAGASAPDSVTAQNTVPAAPADPRWTVTLRGTGGVEYGTPASTAAATLGGEWDDTTSTCDYLRPADGPAGLAFMVEQGRIVRVDVDSAGPVTTEGAAVGMSEAEIRARYPGARSMPHKYAERGRYLVVTSADPADSSRRLIFETDGARVVRYRAGLVPQVEYVERCG